SPRILPHPAVFHGQKRPVPEREDVFPKVQADTRRTVPPDRFPLPEDDPAGVLRRVPEYGKSFHLYSVLCFSYGGVPYFLFSCGSQWYIRRRAQAFFLHRENVSVSSN